MEICKAGGVIGYAKDGKDLMLLLPWPEWVVYNGLLLAWYSELNCSRNVAAVLC